MLMKILGLVVVLGAVAWQVLGGSSPGSSEAATQPGAGQTAELELKNFDKKPTTGSNELKLKDFGNAAPSESGELKLRNFDKQAPAKSDQPTLRSFDKKASSQTPSRRTSSKPDNYLDTIPVFWRSLYSDGSEGLYCGQRYRSHDRSVNIEHVFPMSWATSDLKCGDRQQCRARSERFNRIESDMHNLYPARKDLNKARGSYRYGIIKGENTVERGCDLEIDHRGRVTEPRPAVRGDIARAMLYMEREHGLSLRKKTKDLMVRWHRDDPPSAEERRRNDIIERVQGNRNPFIDG